MVRQFGKGIRYLRDICEYAQKNANQNDRREILNVIEKIKKYFKEQDINN